MALPLLVLMALPLLVLMALVLQVPVAPPQLVLLLLPLPWAPRLGQLCEHDLRGSRPPRPTPPIPSSPYDDAFGPLRSRVVSALQLEQLRARGHPRAPLKRSVALCSSSPKGASR